jgi:hypothetical protein
MKDNLNDTSITPEGQEQMTIEEEVIFAVEQGRLYDFISSESYRMRKDELKNVCLEVIFALSNRFPRGNLSETVKEELIEQIKEREL